MNLSDLFHRASSFRGYPVLTQCGRAHVVMGDRIFYGGKNAVKRRAKQSMRDRGVSKFLPTVGSMNQNT